MSNKHVEAIGDDLDPLLNELAEGITLAADSMAKKVKVSKPTSTHVGTLVSSKKVCTLS